MQAFYIFRCFLLCQHKSFEGDVIFPISQVKKQGLKEITLLGAGAVSQSFITYE